MISVARFPQNTSGGVNFVTYLICYFRARVRFFFDAKAQCAKVTQKQNFMM